MNNKSELDKVVEKLEDYINNNTNKCPFCKSDEIEADAGDGDGWHFWQEITCRSCGEVWSDVYNLVAVDYDYTDEQFKEHKFTITKEMEV